MDICSYEVFISYKRNTAKDFALHLKSGLEEEQINAFLDIVYIPKKFKGVTEWRKFRDTAILKSEVFLLIITDGIERSHEVAEELSSARQRGMECIFLIHEGLNQRIEISLRNETINLGDFNQTKFETSEDLLRRVLRILREPQNTFSLKEKAIASLNDTIKDKGKKSLIDRLRDKAVSTEEIVGRLEDYEVDFLRGNWFLKKKNYEKSLLLYDRALALKPDFVACIIQKGVLLEFMGKSEEAMVWFDKSIEITPTWEAFAFKGTLLNSLGRHEQAVNCYDKSIELKPTDSIFFNKGVALGVLGKRLEAIGSYEKAIEINPKSRESWNNKGFELYLLGKHNESIDCCNKVIEIEPAASVWSLRGLNFMFLNEMEEAKRCFDEAWKIERFPFAMVGLSEIHLLSGDAERGLEEARNALNLSTVVNTRILAWFLCIIGYYLTTANETAEMETKRLVDYLKVDRNIKLNEKDVSLLIPLIETKLGKQYKTRLLRLNLLLKKEISMEEYLEVT
jgi:tetratricopeptide (TPR) repeat protein